MIKVPKKQKAVLTFPLLAHCLQSALLQFAKGTGSNKGSRGIFGDDARNTVAEGKFSQG